MSAFTDDADFAGWLAPKPWFDLAGPPSVRPSTRPDDPLGEDAAILDRWRSAIIDRDEDEVDRLVRLSRAERARCESSTLDYDMLGARLRSERNDRSGGRRQ